MMTLACDAVGQVALSSGTASLDDQRPGVLMYVVYRRGEGRELTKRFTIPAEALQETTEAEYGSILVPIFGERLDDDIIVIASGGTVSSRCSMCSPTRR